MSSASKTHTALNEPYCVIPFMGFLSFHRPQSVCAVSSRTNSPIAPSHSQHHTAPSFTRLSICPRLTLFIQVNHPDQPPKIAKMAPVNDAETQFRFLISCIKNSTAGKVRPTLQSPSIRRIELNLHLQVDFQAVATEMEIVSKAAA